MVHLKRVVALVAAAGAIALAAPSTEAKYKYGQSSRAGAGTEDAGFFVFVEGAIANPRNTDAVVATIENPGGAVTLRPVIPVWDNELAGRIGGGYAFGSGNRVSLTYWGFNAEQTAAGSGPPAGTVFFAVGPPIDATTGVAGSPGFYDLTTEVEASTVEAALSRVLVPDDDFHLGFTVGLRFASYRETTIGTYDEAAAGDATFGEVAYDARKENEADMVGARIGFGGRYWLTDAWSLAAGLGFSFLDGELTATSGLTPSGALNAGTPGSFASVADDSRSGTIFDLDLRAVWNSESERLSVWVGWEQQVWEQLPLDLMRDFPGSPVPLRQRDEVVFSGYKAGLSYKF